MMFFATGPVATWSSIITPNRSLFAKRNDLTMQGSLSASTAVPPLDAWANVVATLAQIASKHAQLLCGLSFASGGSWNCTFCVTDDDGVSVDDFAPPPLTTTMSIGIRVPLPLFMTQAPVFVVVE